MAKERDRELEREKERELAKAVAFANTFPCLLLFPLLLYPLQVMVAITVLNTNKLSPHCTRTNELNQKPLLILTMVA